MRKRRKANSPKIRATEISKKNIPAKKIKILKNGKYTITNKVPLILGAVCLMFLIGLSVYKFYQGDFSRKAPTRAALKAKPKPTQKPAEKPAQKLAKKPAPVIKPKEYVYKPAKENFQAAPKPITVAKKPVLVEPKKKIIVTGPKLVFVIDDVGNTTKNQNLLENLGGNVTYAVLPLLPYSGHFAALSKKTGAELILHLPIKPEGGINPGPGMLSPDMTKQEVLDGLRRNMKSVPNISGMNNHMGSLGTADNGLMEIIIKEARARRLFFLDSFTTPKSVICGVSRKMDMPVLRRDIFLDNVDEPGAIAKQIDKLIEVAKKKGFAIGIGHYRFNTLTVLNEKIPRLKKEGYRVISLKELISGK